MDISDPSRKETIIAIVAILFFLLVMFDCVYHTNFEGVWCYDYQANKWEYKYMLVNDSYFLRLVDPEALNWKYWEPPFLHGSME